jgi:hypothetical protein
MRIQKTWEENENTSIYLKADDFEKYIINTLLPKDSYDLLYKPLDNSDTLEDYVAYTKLPDYKFKSRILDFEFFIVTKFRAKFQDQVLEWCKLFQQKRWQDIDKITPVLLAAGLGGRPSLPERVFLVPVKHLKFVRLYPGFLQKYEVRPDRSVSETVLRRVLE